ALEPTSAKPGTYAKLCAQEGTRGGAASWPEATGWLAHWLATCVSTIDITMRQCRNDQASTVANQEEILQWTEQQQLYLSLHFSFQCLLKPEIRIVAVRSSG